ncbi:MAG: SDR family NAD(P)-dependent oxidoreductase, partial [Akkermansiaceae bacterium]|nr:SDR family NAD(P)-dependent oxidoreductase [Akkermansiaceae bacterium]
MSTAVVTGAGSGIGRAIASELAARGHEITIVEIDAAAGEQSAAEIKESGGIARMVSCDISRTDSVREA